MELQTIKKEISFSDLVDFFKNNEIPTFDDEIDKYGGYFITAARIVAVIIAPDPITKIAVFCSSIDAGSIRVSKLFSWLPDKFKYKDREKFAIDRYELASYVNFILLQIAIKSAVKDVVMPHLVEILQSIQLDDDEKKELEKRSVECDKERNALGLPTNCTLSCDDIGGQAMKIIEPIFSVLSKHVQKRKVKKQSLPELDTEELGKRFLDKVTLLYQAFVINLSAEFPEFALWADVSQKAQIVRELNEVTKALHARDKIEHRRFVRQTEALVKKIEDLRDSKFIKESGFPSFDDTYKKIFKFQVDHLSKILTGKTKDNISAHQNQIKRELDKPLSDNTDVELIRYPLNRDIYISQSFESITYRKKEHRKGFLTADSLGENSEKGENIGNFLLRTLVDPNYATRPIILLGNPGAGKSMLSKMFAGLLCETTDFIPFLIKLRSVASSSASISEHINKGLANSIENTTDVNWLEWAKEFRNRIPVVIMDGFDELMQTSNRELNGYVDAIREFQEKAISSGVCVRIILTSRITVMQDVSIPEGTKIIKLDSFDLKRRDLWTRKWNEAQKKPKHRFTIPKNDKIELLAKEPLLMFMLAVYDFENGELQNMANDKNFNQSKLYDSLLERFIKRQLEKITAFKDATKTRKDKEEELFRLRLGMIALMMFMNDTTSRDTQKLTEEMLAFGIHKSSIQTENILGGFFFIHENKSTTEVDTEKFNYEFLHKTFGEFLAADFVLRVAKKQYQRMFDSSQETIAKEETFNFCFGYNWLHKHNNIQNFLFEHAKQILKPDSSESKFIVNSMIKTNLRELFDKGHQAFPVTDIMLLEKRPIIEHLAIFSQNLVFLWLALADEAQDVTFEIFDSEDKVRDSINEPKYESQDRDEINRNKLLWKRLSKLWSLVGNHNATAKLVEWIGVAEIESGIVLKREKGDVIHNFSNSAEVGCNDFELLLSYFDNELKFVHSYSPLEVIDEIIATKPELSSLAVDVVLHRFIDLYSIEGLKLVKWLTNHEFSRRQEIALFKKVGLLHSELNPEQLREVFEIVTKDLSRILRDNPLVVTEYLRMLVALKSYFPVSQLVDLEFLSDLLHRSSREFGRHELEDRFGYLERIRLLNEVSKFYPFKRNQKIDFFEDSVGRVVSEIRHSARRNPYETYEYLKLLNEIKHFRPARKLMPPELIEEALQMIAVDVIKIVRGHSQAILEYLNLLYDLCEYSLRRDGNRRVIVESLREITPQWEQVFGDGRHIRLEFLKVLSKFSRFFPMEHFMPDRLISESFQVLSEEGIYHFRENPYGSYDYLDVLREFYKFYSLNPERWSEIFSESLDRLSREIEFEFRGDGRSTLAFLELLLINHSMYRKSHRIDDMLENFVRSIPKREFGRGYDIALKAAVLLMQYGARMDLVEYILEFYPKLRNLHVRSPEIARAILEANMELTQYENHN